MRRLLALLALLLLAADAPNVATIDPTAPDLAAEWQAKLATLPAGGTLRVPDAPLPYVTHTIWHGTDRVAIEGPGSQSRRAVVAAVAGVQPIVFLRPDLHWRRGVPDLAATNPDGSFKLSTTFAADHRFDLYGVADSSLAPAPNSRWGVATRTPTGGNARPDAQLWWWDGPPATADGDGWAGVDALTFTILLQGPVRGKYVCGLGDPAEPSPWFLTAGGDGVFHLSFRCKGDAPGPPRSIRFGGPATPGRLLLTFQLGLRTGTVRAWQNLGEVPVARENGVGGPGPAFAGGLSFALNKQCPFTVGSWGRSLQGGDQGYVPDRGDLRIAGFCAHKAELYTSDAAGNQQFAGANAGRPINDLNMLDGVDRAGSFLFSLDNRYSPPAAGPPGREVYVLAAAKLGGYRSEGFFLPFAPDVADPALEDIRVKGLTFTGTNAAATVGQTLMARFDDVVFRGGNVGLSFLPGASIYKVSLDKCGASGANAGIKADSTILAIRDMQWSDFGRVGLSLRGGSATVDGWSAGSLAPPSGGRNEALIEVLDGPGVSLVARGLSADVEGPPGPAYGLVHADRNRTGTTRLVLSDLAPGFLAPGVAAVTLADRYGAARPGAASCRIADLIAPPGGPPVASEGAWSVSPPTGSAP